MMKKLLYLCALLVSLVLLARERSPLTVAYRRAASYDIFPQHLTSVSLYVVDANNRLVQTKLVEQNDLNAFQGTKLNLEPGDYHIVGIGNQYENTIVENIPSGDRSQIIFRHPNTNGDGAVEGSDPPHLGI